MKDGGGANGGTMGLNYGPGFVLLQSLGRAGQHGLHLRWGMGMRPECFVGRFERRGQ